MNTKKGFAPIVWVIIAAILLGGGYAVYRYFQMSSNICWPYCPGMTEQDREDIKKSALDAQVADWKTYRNEKYGFEFKYPPDHTPFTSFNEAKEILYPASQEAGFVTIAENERRIFCCEPLTLSISTIEPAGKRFDAPDARQITFDGYPAVQFDGEGNLGSLFKEILVNKNGLTVTIRQNGKSDFLGEILSTFRFTN